MDKTASYVKYKSSQITDMKENLLFNKIFSFFKNSNFKGKQQK